MQSIWRECRHRSALSIEEYQMWKEKNRYIRRIKETSGENHGRPLTVAFIGTVGVGKSSLINSIAAAMSTKRWKEHAYSGMRGNEAEPMTAFTKRYLQCCRPSEHNTPSLPTLFDIGGIPDENDEIWEEVLRLLFYGRIPETENLLDVYNYLKDTESIRLPRYIVTHETMKVDRVVFVASATEHLPESLIDMVVRVARPLAGHCRRAIPIFGVMTKSDKVDPTGDERAIKHENNFINRLGLGGSRHRFLRCTNYCDDIDPDGDRINTTFSGLDVPILKFMTQICDSNIEVVNTNQNYPFSALTREYSIQILLAFLVIFVLFAKMILG